MQRDMLFWIWLSEVLGQASREFRPLISLYENPYDIFHEDYNSDHTCDCCGETTGANWIRLAGGKKLCLDCYESYDRFDV